VQCPILSVDAGEKRNWISKFSNVLNFNHKLAQQNTSDAGSTEQKKTGSGIFTPDRHALIRVSEFNFFVNFFSTPAATLDDDVRVSAVTVS